MPRVPERRRSRVITLRAIRIRAGAQQLRDRLDITAEHRIQQRRHAKVIPRVDVIPRLDCCENGFLIRRQDGCE